MTHNDFVDVLADRGGAMRTRTVRQSGFRARAIAGTHTVLIAMDCEPEKARGLMGFAIRRTDGGTTKWLRSTRVFESIIPDPLSEMDPDDADQPARLSTERFPVQGFLWSDYTAFPDTPYTYDVYPMTGAPGALRKGSKLTLAVRTEPEDDGRTGIWFNRGVIASQAFNREFGNTGPEPKDNPDPADERTVWLSRGLLEACLDFINRTPKGHGLRVAAYEFTYAPIVEALRDALKRGVDVRIVYDDTTKDKDRAKATNEKAIAAADLPATYRNRQILFPRTRVRIPHNKFIVHLDGRGTPTATWTGSTNFTPSGFLGQSNIGHVVRDADIAATYLQYWKALTADPTRGQSAAIAQQLTPDPPTVVAPRSITALFSPRDDDSLLQWYGARIRNAVNSVSFTAAFGISETLVGPLAEESDTLRFVLMEKPPPTAQQKTLGQGDRVDLQISFGDVLGSLYRYKNGKPTARTKIADFELDKWFLQEEHYRPKNDGFVFFVHTKFLLIDPLSDDPLICTGSANFSTNSLENNDENMLLIRGDTRVADIYLTEFDRIFRHFYARNYINRLHGTGGEKKAAFLDETDSWSRTAFKASTFKSHRRQMFFAPAEQTWAQRAAES